jgi:hypothetical protein
MNPVPYPPLIVLLASIILSSCGIDDYPYLPSVPAGNVRPLELSSGAAIDLPSISGTSYNPSFTFYYRIYLSDVEVPGMVTQEDMSRVNSSLYSDYINLQQYTDGDESRITTIIGSAFTNRNYYTLALEGASIDSLLDENSGLNTVTLDFAETSIAGAVPTLLFNNNSYNLYRFSESGLMRPIPSDRYFFNTSELTRDANISTVDRTNLDIQTKSPTISGPRYAYVSIYIVVTGLDPNYSPIYSRPAFVGIFRLPGGPS